MDVKLFTCNKCRKEFTNVKYAKHLKRKAPCKKTKTPKTPKTPDTPKLVYMSEPDPGEEIHIGVMKETTNTANTANTTNTTNTANTAQGLNQDPFRMNPEVKPWSSMNAFEEGTPIADYLREYGCREDSEDSEDKNLEEGEVPENIKYKSCMDDWLKKEKSKYTNNLSPRRILFDDIEYRVDPYNETLYTREEFYEWYGSNEVWKQQNPRKVLRRDHMVDIAWVYQDLPTDTMDVLLKNIFDTYS